MQTHGSVLIESGIFCGQRQTVGSPVMAKMLLMPLGTLTGSGCGASCFSSLPLSTLFQTDALGLAFHPCPRRASRPESEAPLPELSTGPPTGQEGRGPEAEGLPEKVSEA